MISIVVMPARRPSSRRAAASDRSVASRRRPGRVDRHVDAARLVRATGHAGRELRRRSPANTRCVWLSTKPGITHRPPASIRRSAAGAPPVPTRDDRRRRRTRRGRRGGCRAHRRHPRRIGGVVRDQHADVVDHGGRHTASTARRQLAGDVETDVRAVAHDHLTADDDVVDVGRRGREHDRLEQVLAAGAGQPHRVEPHRAQVGQRTRLQPPAPPASRGWRGRWRWRPAAGSARRGCRAPGSPAARRARPHAPPRTGRSRHASRSRGRAPLRRRAAPAPGRSRRPGRARSSDRGTPSIGWRRGPSTSASVRWVACTAVKRSPSTPCRSSRPTGVTP